MRFTRSLCFTSALLLAIVPARAPSADESGGTESPFAFGAGARALALGGAYVAVAEGPAATTWNPAGLAGTQVKQVSFFYTSPFTDGNQYTFVGYVHPFLDLGTMAFANARYGVDGIRKFDSGGRELGEFSNVQNEWLLSYALPPFGPARFGASIKVETQSIDNETATAVGADLGFLFRSSEHDRSVWSVSNLSFGISIRNALEPRLTLRAEEENLPTLIRSGLAYSLPLRGSLRDRLLLVLAFEQGKESGGRTRFGSEMDLPHGLSFRAGGGPDDWSTGMGLALLGGRLDYSFGSQELGTAHRLELSMSFGSSLDMLLADRALRDEEALALRTQEEIARNEKIQAETNIREGMVHFDRAEYALAEASFERALLWDPVNETANEFHVKSRVRKHLEEGIRQARTGNLLEAVSEYSLAAAADPSDDEAADKLASATVQLNRSTARSREVSNALTRGIEYLALSEFPAAQEQFRSALQIEPDNADVQRYLARTDSLIARRVDALVAEANWYRDRKDRATARQRYSEAIALRPGRDDLRREIRRLDAAPPEGEEAAGQSSEPAVRRAPRVLSVEEAREAERMYKAGVDEFRQRRNREAIRYFEFVYDLVPTYEKVDSYLKQAYLFTGMEHYTSGEISEAVDVWEKILGVDPEDDQALTYLRRARIAIQKAEELTGGAR